MFLVIDYKKKIIKKKVVGFLFILNRFVQIIVGFVIPILYALLPAVEDVRLLVLCNLLHYIWWFLFYQNYFQKQKETSWKKKERTGHSKKQPNDREATYKSHHGKSICDVRFCSVDMMKKKIQEQNRKKKYHTKTLKINLNIYWNVMKLFRVKNLLKRFTIALKPKQKKKAFFFEKKKVNDCTKTQLREKATFCQQNHQNQGGVLGISPPEIMD